MALSKVLLQFLGFLNEALYNTGVMDAFESNFGFRLRNKKIKILKITYSSYPFLAKFSGYESLFCF